MSAPRNQSVDLFRLVAAFGVVLIHMAPSTPAGEALSRAILPFPVPYFYFISLYFFIPRALRLSASNPWELRSDRILVPCATWTTAYLLLRTLKYHLLGRSLEWDWIGFVLFGKAALPLHFLPHLLLFQALALSAVLLFRGGAGSLLGAFVGVVASYFGYFASAEHYFGFDNALPSGVVYVGFALLLVWSQKFQLGRQINRGIGFCAVAFLLMTAIHGAPPIAMGIFHLPAIGYGVSALALNLPFQTSNPALRRLLSFSYGIYLAHFGFIEAFEFLGTRLGFWHPPYGAAEKIALTLAISLLCGLLIILLRKHWLSAYLFLGEKPRKKPREEAVPAVSELAPGISPL